MNKSYEKFDVFIVGGNITGLICAIALSQNKIKVGCCDPNIDINNFNSEDTRSTAILRSGKKFLENLNIWTNLKNSCLPLDKMEIIDDNKIFKKFSLFENYIFDSQELLEKPFGWNVKNNVLKRTLVELVKKSKNIKFFSNQSFEKLLIKKQTITINLSKEKIETNFLIGADGLNSKVKQSIRVKQTLLNTRQKALSFQIEHEKSHKNISTEIYKEGGPLTFVPTKAKDKMNYSSVIWMNHSKESEKLYNLPKHEFEKQLNKRSLGIYGKLNLKSNINLWNVNTMFVENLCYKNVILVGEAAHVLPPIGAQGLNTSLKDISILMEIFQNKNELSYQELALKYETKRLPDIKKKIFSILLLNEVVKSNSIPVMFIRRFGIEMISKIGFLRKNIMRFGLS